MNQEVTTNLPDIGQLVQLRNKRYVVTNVQAQPIPPDYRIEKKYTHSAFNLVTIASLEDDELGKELQIFWELEIAAKAYAFRKLPRPQEFDPPARLEAFLDAMRWGTGSTADVRNIQAPFRSGIDLEDYQLDPLVRAVQMSRVNLLIADDVGLGKTIEAGLVAQELLIRQRAKRILIICPSALQIQWQEQMRSKFGLEFRIINREFLKQLRREQGLPINPWSNFPRMITSIDFIKREGPFQALMQILPGKGESPYPRRFDLMILDEAHNVAPSGGGQYALDSQRTKTIRQLVPHFEHKLFLTATPHNGYPESFTALLELLDNQRFARGIAPDRQQLQKVMIRRLKQDLPPRWDGTPRFPQRLLDAIPVDYPEAEKQAHRQLMTYTQLRRQGVQDNVEGTATDFVLKLLKKRLFSSPAAFLTTLLQHQQSLQDATRAQRHLAPPTLKVLERHFEEMAEEFADDELYEESTESAVITSSALFHPLSDQEKELLGKLQAWAETAEAQPDAKAQELLRWIAKVIKPEGKWSDERVIIFTEYRTTQKWLYDLLVRQELGSDERLLTLYGGMNSEERERIKAAFQASPELSQVRILLATDAASEGLDLQNYCSNLIHYEIPWNPNRLEQRNGRIDRHGQKAPAVKIYHFVGKNYAEAGQQSRRPGDLEGDLEFLMRAALKVNNIREDLGKVGPVIATQVEEAMVGERLGLDTTVAERESEAIRKLWRFDKKIQDQIEYLKAQLQDARHHLNLKPERVLELVRVGLQLAEHMPLEPVVEEPGLYHLPFFKGSWNIAREGLEHPHTKEIRPVVFDPYLAAGRDDRVLIHLNHRLVQMCLKLMRTPIWMREGCEQLKRVSGKVVPKEVLEFPGVIGYSRLLILGNDHQRLHEEVIVAGGMLKEGKYTPLSQEKITQALDAAVPEPIGETMQQRLLQCWDIYEQPLLRSLDKRKDERFGTLLKDLAKRCDQEVTDITTILTELAKSIRQELAQAAQPQQLELFNEGEREQFFSNRASLEARLQEIPQEIEQETSLIRSRFAEPVCRLFTLAIIYLVPRHLL